MNHMHCNICCFDICCWLWLESLFTTSLSDSALNELRNDQTLLNVSCDNWAGRMSGRLRCSLSQRWDGRLEKWSWFHWSGQHCWELSFHFDLLTYFRNSPDKLFYVPEVYCKMNAVNFISWWDSQNKLVDMILNF